MHYLAQGAATTATPTKNFLTLLTDKYKLTHVRILLVVTMMKYQRFMSNRGLKRGSFFLVIFNSTAVLFHLRFANRLFKNPWFYNFILYF
jgi:nicotinic acid phosphoribosyltransferase